MSTAEVTTAEVTTAEVTTATTAPIGAPDAEVGTAVVQGRNEDGTPGPTIVHGVEIGDAATLER